MKLALARGKYLNCESEDCPFRKECANHTTAGDFRSEGGFSPSMEKAEDGYLCKTRDSEVDMDAVSGVFPKDIPSGQGYVYLSNKGELVSYNGPFEEME